MWYGVSAIAPKLLNQALMFVLTYILHTQAGMVEYGNMTMIYSGISLVNIIYTYGLETAYFRFSSADTDKERLFQTSFTSLLLSSVLFSAVLIGLREPIAAFLGIEQHAEYVTWCVLIIALETLIALPFARLRQEGRPRKYALIRVLGVLVFIVLSTFLVHYAPKIVAAAPGNAFAAWYGKYTPVGFLLLANLVQNVVTFLLLFGEWRTFRMRWDAELWKKVVSYSWPMLIVGMGGMVNETMDRLMLPKLLPGSEEMAKIETGIYAANYKIAIAISLFIQAFRMSAEPFFFSHSGGKNAPATYARVMKWFVITLCVAFLFTALYLDLWKYLIAPEYRQGLGVVPILLAANIALGIYYNLSVWYKITDRMRWGMYITLIGAAITVGLNVALVPVYGMYACAWATLAAYSSMMLLSYFAGQRFFPVPYDMGRLLTYLGAMLGLFFVQQAVSRLGAGQMASVLCATVCMGLFVALVVRCEREELAGMPVIGKFLKKRG